MLGQTIEKMLHEEIDSHPVGRPTKRMLKLCIDKAGRAVDAMCPAAVHAGKDGTTFMCGPMIPPGASLVLVFATIKTSCAIGIVEDEFKDVPDLPAKFDEHAAQVWDFIAGQVDIGTRDALLHAATVLFGRIGTAGQAALAEKLMICRKERQTPVMIALAARKRKALRNGQTTTTATGMVVTYGLPATLDAQMHNAEGTSH